jgi:hypothetical protein
MYFQLGQLEINNKTDHITQMTLKKGMLGVAMNVDGRSETSVEFSLYIRAVSRRTT